MRRIVFFAMMLLLTCSAFAQQAVEGTVTDVKTGETLIGVTVQIKGTSSGTTTDIYGKYRLSAEQLNPASVIIYSYIGYTSIEQIRGSQPVIDVKLTPQQTMLDEVVVIGYGTAKKRNVLGAVTTVSSKDLQQLPLADVSQALQGRAAGVLVTQNTGAPGEGVSVRIRGTGSISSSNGPLFIVDGIATNDALRLLSPGDIESITVLKDASAAAIYGSRANNGIVLITTKKGKKGETQITYRGQTGFQKATGLTKMVNTRDYVTIYNEAATNDNAFLPSTLQRPLITDEDAARFADVNYVDELLQTAPINSHELSLSGGTESTNYILSTSFFDQKGIIKGSGYTRGTARLDVNTEASKWLTIGMSMLAGISSTDIIGSSGDGAGGNGGSVIRYAFFRNPAIPVRFDDGHYVDRPAEYFGDQKFDSFLGDGYNPIGMSDYNDNNRKDDSYLGKAYFIAKLTKKLKFTTNIGMDYRNSNSRRFNPTWGTLNRINARNGLDISNERTFNWMLNNLLNYETSIGDSHNFSALLGFEAIKNGGKAMYANLINSTGHNYSILINSGETRFVSYGSLGFSDIDINSPYLFLLDVINSTSVLKDFIFNVSDDSDLLSCILYLNNSVNVSNSSTINKSSTNTIRYSSLPVGSYTAYVNCTDQYNFTGKSNTIAFNIAEEFVELGVSFSSFVGGSAGPMTRSLSDSTFTNGFTSNFRKGDSLRFEVSNQTHNLTVNNVSNSSITITIQSTPQTFTLKVGDILNVDVNNDGLKDIEVSYLKYLTSVVSLKVRAIALPYEVPSVKNETNTSSPYGVGDSANQEGIKDFGKKLFYGLAIVLVLVLTIKILIRSISKRKK